MTDRVLTAEDFIPYVGAGFTPLGQHRALVLVSVDRPASAGSDALPRPPFCLLFSGPADDVLPEGLYDVIVQDGPAFALYIAPIQTFVWDRQDYQAVFN